MKYLFFSLLLSGCASIPQASNPIQFSEIEKLSIGSSTKQDVLKAFGKATHIRTNFAPHEVWIYRANSEIANELQNAAFTFDQNGVMIGAVWLPISSRDFISPQQLITHFKNHHFKTEKQDLNKPGQTHSEDILYRDEKTGISFTVNPSDKKVMGIFFGTPSNRVPAKL